MHLKPKVRKVGKERNRRTWKKTRRINPKGKANLFSSSHPKLLMMTVSRAQVCLPRLRHWFCLKRFVLAIVFCQIDLLYKKGERCVRLCTIFIVSISLGQLKFDCGRSCIVCETDISFVLLKLCSGHQYVMISLVWKIKSLQQGFQTDMVPASACKNFAPPCKEEYDFK